MPFTNYLQEIEFAAKNVLTTIWAERRNLDDLKAEVSKMGVGVSYEYQRAMALQESDDPDNAMMGVGLYWNNYFGADKEMYHKNEASIDLANRIVIHEFSTASRSGNILQYAKQGISIVHGNPSNCSDGRLIGTQPLKTVIWQSRNQALHWEEGNFRPPVQQCFQQLAAEFDAKFNDYTQRSMAFDIVELLGWKDYSAFESDLLSLQ